MVPGRSFLRTALYFSVSTASHPSSWKIVRARFLTPCGMFISSSGRLRRPRTPSGWRCQRHWRTGSGYAEQIQRASSELSVEAAPRLTFLGHVQGLLPSHVQYVSSHRMSQVMKKLAVTSMLRSVCNTESSGQNTGHNLLATAVCPEKTCGPHSCIPGARCTVSGCPA